MAVITSSVTKIRFCVADITFSGFVKLKKSEKKVGSGWVDQAPTRIFCGNFVFFVLLYIFQKKKLDRVMGVCANPSFSRIFGFFELDNIP